MNNITIINHMGITVTVDLDAIPLKGKVLSPEEAGLLLPVNCEIQPEKLEKLAELGTRLSGFSSKEEQTVLDCIPILTTEEGLIINGKHRAYISARGSLFLESYLIKGTLNEGIGDIRSLPFNYFQAIDSDYSYAEWTLDKISKDIAARREGGYPLTISDLLSNHTKEKGKPQHPIIAQPAYTNS